MRRLLCSTLVLAACSADDLAPAANAEETTGDTTGVAEAPTEEEMEPPLPDFDGEPLPERPVGEWQWVEFAGATCRDGTPSGIGVRYGTSDDLLIFFEGGGACFNGFTCFANPAHFDADDFADWSVWGGQGGLFADWHEDNPVRDWSAIYVPYCTGDVHAGSAADALVPGGPEEPQQFVGYANMELFLRRIVPTFGAAPRVLITGVSAGGFGSGLQLHRLARVFAGSRVTLVDDSGPAFRDRYLAPCLQRQWRDLWRLDAALPPRCPGCFGADGGGISEVFSYLGERHPDVRMGLLSHERDATIRIFFGFGLDECGDAGALFGPNLFAEALYDLRDEVLRPAGWATYFAEGSDHTFFSAFDQMYQTEVGGVALTDWLADLIDGEVRHVSP